MGARIKLYHIFALLVLLLACGCKSHSNEPIPVTMLLSPSTAAIQDKDRQHLQGGSLDADRQAAARMDRLLVGVPECRNYDDEVLRNLDQSAYTNCSVGTVFYLRIEIYPDGSIGNVAVDGWTNTISTPLFIKDIKQSHFPKWPRKMRSIVGHDYFVMWINTGMPYPPGLN